MVDIGSLAGIVIGGASAFDRDVDRATRRLPQQIRNGERIVDALENADERRAIRNNRIDTQVIRSQDQLETALDRFESRRGRGGDRDDDRRGDFAAGRGGQGPRGLSGSHSRGDDARDGQGQGQDPRILATEDYVYALADAAQSPAGSPERAAAMQKAKDILTKPENGLIQSDGSVRFPEGMKVILESNGKQSSYIEFNGIHARATSPEVSIQKGVNAVAGQRIGTALTDADIAALRGTAAPAGATIPVGTGEEPKTDAPQAPGTGTAKPDAPGAATFALPEASGPAAKIYTKNGEGRTMNAEDAPKISASQVKAIQAKLGVKDDGMWGPNTQAAFAAAAAKAGVKPSDVDFTNPNDPETVKVMAQFNAAAAVATVNTPAAGAGQGSAPSSPPLGHADHSAASLDKAVSLLTRLAGEDKHIGSADLKRFAADAAGINAVGRVYDLNQDGKVAQTEMDKIVAAANKANGVTIEGGAPALNALFTDVTLAAAPAPAADAGQATAPAATDATRLADAVKVLETTAGADRELSAGNIAALQQTPELMKTVGQAFDLDRNGAVDKVELERIVAAAAAKPEAERVTVVGGVAALNPLFAGASFAPVQPATDVATVDSPAPGLAQTAQVNPQTGEVKPPAAAPASAPLRTENAVYVVPEPTFEPSSQGVPKAEGFVKGGGLTFV